MESRTAVDVEVVPVKDAGIFGLSFKALDGLCEIPRKRSTDWASLLSCLFIEASPTVGKDIPNYLKLHVENAPEQQHPDLANFPGLAAMCRAFEETTGWALRYETEGETGTASPPWSASVESGFGGPIGRLVIESSPAELDHEGRSRLPLGEVQPMGEALRQMLNELERTRYALWQREAELAAGVPIIPHADEKAHLAERLESVLRGGAEAVGCQAAALYLLDEGTSQLKLRASWGLPQSRLLESARPLRGSVADLEALVGHAVVLEDTSVLPHWKSPEDFPSAVCVPVSSPTMPLGTLWIFSDSVRDFTAEQTNMLEIVAGRLAADLEREMLMQEGIQSKQFDRSLARAVHWQQDRQPQIEPLLDDWQLAGWTSQADSLGGDFFDWSILPDGNLAVAVAGAQGTMIEAGLSAASLHGAMKSHGCYSHNARQMLDRLNETLWTASAGDQFASMFYGLVHPEIGKLDFASAGHALAFLLRGNTCRVITHDSLPLGSQPETDYKPHRKTLKPGDALLMVSPGVRETLEQDGQPLDVADVAAAMHGTLSAPAEEIVQRMRDFISSRSSEKTLYDHTILVMRRR